MAIVVESTSNATATSSATLTITKPTGLVVGDVLIAVICNFDTTDTVQVPAGWTDINSGACADGSQKVLGKVADSSDVAASNFSFTTTGSSQIISGGLMRVSGITNLFDGVFDNDTDNSHVGSSISFSTTVSPVSNGALWIISTTTNDGDASNNDIYNYFATGSSVTFTELFTNTGARLMGAAYGVQATASAATAYGYDFGLDGSPQGGVDNHGAALTVLYEKVNGTGSNTLVEATAVSTTQTGTADTLGTVSDFAEATAVATEQTGRGDSPTQWTNEAGNTTTWTNETTL